jgi:hypothetical protein
MKSLLLAFSAAFTFVGTIAVITSSGCSSGENCGQGPERPKPQAVLLSLEVSSSDAMGKPLSLPVVPENGSLEVTGDQVLIRYRQGDLDYLVEYRVAGPR